jgi:hypothetical protein
MSTNKVIAIAATAIATVMLFLRRLKPEVVQPKPEAPIMDVPTLQTVSKPVLQPIIIAPPAALTPAATPRGSKKKSKYFDDTSHCGGTGMFKDFVLAELRKQPRTYNELLGIAELTAPQLCTDKSLCAHSNDYCWQHSIRWDMQKLREEGKIKHNGGRPALWLSN